MINGEWEFASSSNLDHPLDRPDVFELTIGGTFRRMIHDNTKPLARVGRKAYRVSMRQPGRRNISRYLDPAFFMGKFAGPNPESEY